MARIVNPLTAKQVKDAKPSEKIITLYDGDGLQLRIKPNGSKLWYFSYSRPNSKKRNVLSLGAYPALSLANARIFTRNNKELLSQGIDPQTHRDEQQRQKKEETENTFYNVASRWFEVKKDEITPDYAEDIWRSLESYIFPDLGKYQVSDITAPQVIQILKPVEASGKLDTVKRLIQRTNEVMIFAVNTGVIFANPLAGIKSAFKKPEKKNNPALSPNEISALIKAVNNSTARKVTKLLVMWQLHTMTRPNESATAEWCDLDLENKLWIIPAEKMKKRREHRIPLTPQMLDIIEELKLISGNRPYLFPADRDPKRHIHEQSANALLVRLGFKDKTTAHGLRALASTTLNEQGFNAEIIEACLAHVDKNQTRSAYNHTDYLERRRKVTEWWSEHIEKATYSKPTLTGTQTLRAV